MEIQSKKQKLLPFILSLAIIALDQLSKAWIVAGYPKEGTLIADVFHNGFLWIVHVRNKAIAFSLGHSLPDSAKTALFIVLPVVVLCALMYYYLKTDEFSALQRWAICGIIGGGWGNLIDRIFRRDGVVDFISVNVYGLLGFSRWPTFNVADASVVVCGILLVISMSFAGKKNKGDYRE